MKKFIKENFIVVLAFMLPVVIIVVVALSTYLPAMFISTDYNFIYASCIDGKYDFYECGNYLGKKYEVVDGQLVVNSTDEEQILDSNGNAKTETCDYCTARIFLHNTEKNEGREITLEEAKTLTLNGLLTSPDGVTVSSHYDRGADFFPIFDGSSSYGYYLTKGKSKSKLSLINSDERYYYRDNFQFLGWVLPGRN